MSALAAERREAREPPERRGAGRDDVALLVSSRHDGRLAHARFGELARFLVPGDLLVVNTSATLPAALPATLAGRALELRLSTPTESGAWIVELRSEERLPQPLPPLPAAVELPGGARARLLARYLDSERLALARLELGAPLEAYLQRHGRPIRYGYVPERWPIEAYQTVFAREPGSVEMPSAGRPFSTALVTELVAAGVLFAPLSLHTGLSSPERGEPPLPERYRVPAPTAALVNAVRELGGRVIAVGTTACRALETVAAPGGSVAAGAGWTRHLVTAEGGLRAVDGLLTGFHEPRSSHLQLLEAVAGRPLLARSYRAALSHGYLWHEFGDVHLILP